MECLLEEQLVPAPVAERANFDAAVLQHIDELIGTAVRLTGSRTEAEDLVQESILRAWLFWGRFEQGTNCRAWLHRIVMNTFINGYRRKKRERDILQSVGTDPTVVDDFESTAKRAALGGVGDEVSAALATLPEEFRTVVLLVDIEEKSYHEVAQSLGCPIGTVMSRLHRARRALKHRLRAYAQAEGYVHETLAKAA